MKNKKQIIICAVSALMVAALIFFLSSQNGTDSFALSERIAGALTRRRLDFLIPDLTGSGILFDIRKCGHIFLFFCLSALICVLVRRCFPKAGRLLKAAADTGAALICFLFACLDEWHQFFVPGRHSTPEDLKFDAAGIVSGILFVWICMGIVGLIRGRGKA